MPPLPSDPHHLQRFVDAQASTYAQARSELAAGHKRSHWMWFIFPQIRGLGSSPTAQQFALSGLPEASAYLAHPLLGPRLRECTALVNAVQDRSIQQIFPYPDNLKFHSSVTLFSRAAPPDNGPDNGPNNGPDNGQDNAVFTEAIARFFSGAPDRATINLL